MVWYGVATVCIEHYVLNVHLRTAKIVLEHALHARCESSFTGSCDGRHALESGSHSPV